MQKISFYVFIFLLFSLLSCKSENTNSTKNESQDLKNEESKQLNITILLDLSDRIEPSKYPSIPEHFERDIEIVEYITLLFKKDMEQRGAFRANGKLKVIFSPRPEDDEINASASSLNIDLSQVKDTKEKKRIYDNLSSIFRENLLRIYKKSIETKHYLGSDIWRFFKNDVVDFCIEENKDYKNVLILITDGYIYHYDSKDKQNNRTAYLLPKGIESSGLRKSNWKEIFDKNDFGFITTRNDLSGLEILVLEINPSKNNKNDEDVIKAYLSKWFSEMNIPNFKIYNSDLPAYTKARIDKFFY